MTSGTFHQFASWFRDSSPYINAHKGRILVLAFGGEAVVDERFSIVHDIALLSTLGVRLVLVHGSRRGRAGQHRQPPPAPCCAARA